MSIYSSRRKTRKHSHSQAGHLKLSIYEEASALVVNIFEARGLMSRDADVYIKLYLLPDPQKSTKRKTKVFKQQDPIFNQRFTFLLSKRDTDKRLLISAWTPHFTSRNVMIGCMCFPLSKLVGPNKGLNGWFQLLDEDKGLTEHQPVPSSISVGSLTAQRPGANLFAVTLRHRAEGYGFDVSGHNPVHISNLEPGQAAQQADIQEGDVVVEVDKTDVMRANAELVQDLIEKSGETLQLILQRDSTTKTSRPPALSSSSSSSSYHRDTHTLPRSHRPHSPPTPTHPSTHTFTQPSSTSSISYGTLSQDHLPLRSSLSAQGSHYSSLSHLPRERKLSGPAMSASTDVLSQPTNLSTFEYKLQDQFVHEAVHMRHSARTQRPSLPVMHSVYEEREDMTEEAGGAVGRGRGEGERFQRQPVRQMVSGVPTARQNRERGRRRRSSGEELTQPVLPAGFSSSHHRQPSYPAFSLSQPEESGVRTTYPPFQLGSAHFGHTHYHQKPARKRRDKYSLTQDAGGSGEGDREREVVRRMEKDAMTGEPQQYPGHVTSVSPNHPSHHPNAHNRYSNHHHHGNVELTGHQPLVASHSSGNYVVDQYGNGTGIHGFGSSSRTGMGPADGALNELEEGPIDWESLPPTAHKRQKVLHSLVVAESTFCSELQNGVETYLEPLRPVMSDSAHNTLFCNLRELSEQSAEIVLQLSERKLPYEGGAPEEAPPHYITHVADIYHSKLPELLRLLGEYLDNLHSAKEALSLAFTNEEFTLLAQKSVIVGKKRSIYVFIEAGKDYVTKLFKALLGTYYYTPASDVDQSYLSTALRQLAKICPDKDTVARWEREQKMMHNLQVCVGFAPKLPHIHIAVPGRILVKEGEATLIEKKRKRKVWILLFSDIILLTQRNGKLLMCLEPAVPLVKLTVNDFNCEDTEFQITNTEGSLFRLLRVQSVSEKAKWMTSIKERATGSFQRKHGERTSRLTRNLLKHHPPLPPPLPVPAAEEESGRLHGSRSAVECLSSAGGPGANPAAAVGAPHPPLRKSNSGSRMRPWSRHRSYQEEEGEGGGGGGGGRSGKRLSQQLDQPDLGLGAAATQLPDWKRTTSKRRSFNLFGGKGSKEKKKKDSKKHADLPSPQGQGRPQSPTEQNLTFSDVPPDSLRRWEKSLEVVLRDPAGRVLFHKHLKVEYSEENILFWLEVEKFKTVSDDNLEKEANVIVTKFVGEDAPKSLNIDAQTVEDIMKNLQHPHRDMFSRAFQHVYFLMARDSYARFIKSDDFKKAAYRDRPDLPHSPTP